MKLYGYIVFAVAVLLAACERDGYETGDGTYSHLRTDYVSVDVRGGYAQSITTDENTPLNITTSMRVTEEPKDTLLRWLLYYNKVSDSEPIDIVGTNTMILLKPYDETSVSEVKTDPVKVTSVWLAANRKYLNLRIGLMTGNSTSYNDKHTVAMVLNGIADGTAYYTFYHDQADVTQYYTQEVFFTMECPDVKTIDLTINTYNGKWHRQFTIHNS